MSRRGNEGAERPCPTLGTRNSLKNKRLGPDLWPNVDAFHAFTCNTCPETLGTCKQLDFIVTAVAQLSFPAGDDVLRNALSLLGQFVKSLQNIPAVCTLFMQTKDVGMCAENPQKCYHTAFTRAQVTKPEFRNRICFPSQIQEN